MIQRLVIGTKTLHKTLKYNYLEEWGEHYIGRPRYLKTPEPYKKIFRKEKQLRPIAKNRANFYDVLHMPGLDDQGMLNIQKQIITKGEVALSNQFIAILLYNMSKRKLLLQQTLNIIDEWIPRHKGQYTARQIFGCIYGSIIYNRPKYINFFLEQVKASNFEFQITQALQMVQALNQNKHMSLQQKHKFWQENFKKAFMDNLYKVTTARISLTLRFYEAFKQFQYFDQQIWDRIIIMMDNKTGWARTVLIEKLYPITGTFQKAKMLFDKYYTKLSTNKNIQWRYNLEQLRLYSSEQMIAKSQQNIQMHPTFRTMLPKEKLHEITQRYQNWLVNGAVKEQQQIIRDKSASFGYAIKDRFESLTKDNVDFSKLTKKEFEQLFGEYDEATMKDKQQVQPQAEQPEQAAEGQQQNK